MPTQVKTTGLPMIFMGTLYRLETPPLPDSDNENGYYRYDLIVDPEGTARVEVQPQGEIGCGAFPHYSGNFATLTDAVDAVLGYLDEDAQSLGITLPALLAMMGSDQQDVIRDRMDEIRAIIDGR